ncbi:nudix hydrolase 15, mitochondrial-like isoform X3 [Humulus lupulus]|uniref:nudix hydrolase 15, mitochondrial-like isoform X3 n=1 Tax=Humulus lupulus TaxID=3486 RepID=UPI002B4004D3|nr:nudix hydrolase 15, mitochondrial-like isoform X3 [Humulus lupulus]
MGSNDDATWAGSRRLKTLANHFSNQKQPQAAAAGFAKRAAVLVCLFPGDDGNLRVILTKRASTLSSYSGEVSLPGGKMDEGDADCVDTALREAKEEIGLDPSQVLVVTTLDPFIAKGDVLVVPVIGLLRDKRAFNPIPNTAEVEAVFDAPLDLFLKVIYPYIGQFLKSAHQSNYRTRIEEQRRKSGKEKSSYAIFSTMNVTTRNM